MAISFRQGVSAAVVGLVDKTMNPGVDPVSGDILILHMGQCNNVGFPNDATATSNTFGGTWTEIIPAADRSWATRRRHNALINTSMTTPTGSVVADGDSNQQRANSLIVVEGASSYTVLDSDSSSSAPNYTAGPPPLDPYDAYLMLIQQESNTALPSPPPDGWQQLYQTSESLGIRSFSAFYFLGTLPDNTPTSTWSGSAGFSGVTIGFTEAATGSIQNIKLGDLTVNKMYLGDTEVTKAYLGDIQVFGPT